VGIPETVQLDESKVSPVGTISGVIVQEAMAPPELTGAVAEIKEPTEVVIPPEKLMEGTVRPVPVAVAWKLIGEPLPPAEQAESAKLADKSSAKLFARMEKKLVLKAPFRSIINVPPKNVPAK